MAHLRIRYPLPGDAPGQWSGELLRDGDIPDLGQSIELPAGRHPGRFRVVALLFRATLAFVGIDADVYASPSDAGTRPMIVSDADPEPRTGR